MIKEITEDEYLEGIGEPCKTISAAGVCSVFIQIYPIRANIHAAFYEHDGVYYKGETTLDIKL